MDMKKSQRNSAAVRYLRGVKASSAKTFTYVDLSETTGIPVSTMKKLMTNRSELTVDQFLLIAEALGVPAAEALQSLSQVVRQGNL